ncbi:MAG TPA: diguanylate cyclase [Treponemataceae bacterium]|nr:diguanylate cyclase [Treponemataceae bacterium]
MKKQKRAFTICILLFFICIPLYAQNVFVSMYDVHAKTILIIANLFLIVLFAALLIVIVLIKKAYRKINNKNIKLKLAQEKAEFLSLHDSLTDLYNRRAIEPMIIHEMNHKKRFNTPVSLLIADIDHFKKVNDIYGHDVGDIVLKRLAQLFIDYSRVTDIPSRWGGEEFLIVLTNTTEQGAILLAQKMRKACEKLMFEECKKITISIGVAQNNRDETFEQWFKKADRALYIAKNTGRNKVVAASGLDPESLIEKSEHELLLLQLIWRDDYCVGVATVDAQHRDLFTASNMIIDAIVKNESEKHITDLLHVLFTQTKTHFKEEEKYLKKEKCSRLEQHKEEHNRLLDTFKDHILDFSQNRISPYNFIAFICNDLVIGHILGEDKKSFDGLKN